MHESPYSKVAKKMYMKETNPTQIHEEKKRRDNQDQRSATTPVYINGSHTRDMLSCGATHMFHHSEGALLPSIIHNTFPMRQFLETKPVDKKKVAKLRRRRRHQL